jgi:outer membrane cobalamin receptor
MRRLLLSTVALALLIGWSGSATAQRDDDDAPKGKPVAAAPAAPVPVARDSDEVAPVAPSAITPTAAADDDDEKVVETEIVVTARRLDFARESVEPALGATRYSLTNDTIEARPGGETTTIGQVLQQVPGVADGGSGRLVVRGVRGGVEYRLNNIILPDALGEVGERLSSRLAARIDLLTGALPAQYGLSGGSVVNIVTKSGAYLVGGQAELYGGAQGEFEPAFEAGGSRGKTSGFVSASYLTSRIGLAAPDAGASPRHDRTRQVEGFGYLDQLIDEKSRVLLIVGSSNERFEVPDGISTRAEANHYAVASYLLTAGATTVQASLFGRASVSRLRGPVAFAAHGTSVGTQVEAVHKLGASHALRAGTVVSEERQRGVAHRSSASVFVQDEWGAARGLTVNGGLRLDRVGGTGGGTMLGPRIGVVWQPGAGTTLHAGYARYLFAAPIERSVSTDARDAARAERDDYVDVGAQRVAGRVTLGIDAYWRRARGLLGARGTAPEPIEQDFNFARGSVRGVEASLLYADGPASGWASVAVARGRGRGLVSGDDFFSLAERAMLAANSVALPDVQAVTASGGGSYRFGKFRLSGDLLYGSGLPRGLFTNERLPGYVRVDVAAVLRLPGLGHKPLDLRADVVNLFDHPYQLRAANGSRLAEWGQRRGLFVGLEQGF